MVPKGLRRFRGCRRWRSARVLVEQVREELRPDLDRVEEERERIRAEEWAELQRQYDEFERSGCGCVRRGWRSLEPSSR